MWLDATSIDVRQEIEITTTSTHDAVVTLVSHAGTQEVSAPQGSSARSITLN